MSLYRAGLRLALSLPLGVAVSVCADSRVRRCEPRFHSALTGKGDLCVDRTRVRKPSAIGSTCLAQPIVFNLPPPDGQGDQSAIPNLGFSGSGPGPRHRDPV